MKFYQITDLHFYPAKAMKAQGEQWEYRTTYDQKCIAESEAILDATIELLLKDEETDIIFITGDNVCDGERIGHFELKKKLDKLVAAGKRLFLITGTHDLHPCPLGYSLEKGEHRVAGCTKQELIEIYGDFGYNDAIAVHKSTFSYVAMLDERTRLLALNDDGVGFEDGFHGYFNNQLEWIKEQLEEGKKAGDRMLVITHHPMLAPSPFYEFYCKDQMLGDCDYIKELFADAGVQFVFTGHTHMQNINYFDTDKGNRIYDINTASLIGYPSPIRHFELTRSKLIVKTLHIDKPDYDLKGMSYMNYSRYHFDYMLKDIVSSAANDFEHFVKVAEGFSLHEEQARKLKPFILALGKMLDKLTFKKAGRLLMCKSRIAPRMYEMKLADFVISLVGNMYGGDEPYAPGTAEYDSFMAIYEKLAPFVHKALGTDEIDDVIKGVLYDDGFPDNDAELPIMRYRE